MLLRTPLPLLFLSVIAPVPAIAVVINVSPGQNVEAVIATAMPGDEVVLAGGTYDLTSFGRFTISVSGTAVAPIVVRAAAGEQPIISQAVENVVDIGGSHLVLRGLELTGGNKGVDFDPTASFVTIEDCYIHDVQQDGVAADQSIQGIRILRNEIAETGLSGVGVGIRLGCNGNVCQTFDSVVEGNYIHSTNGPAGDGIRVAEGSHTNAIEDNVVHGAGALGISVGPTLGMGAANTVARNVVWGTGDHAIAAVSDARILNNIVMLGPGSSSSAIRVASGAGADPTNVDVQHNTILYAGSTPALDISGCPALCTVTIANNAIYAPNVEAIRGQSLTGLPIFSANIGAGTVNGLTLGVSEFDASGSLVSDFVAANLGGAPPNDAFPAVGSALVGSSSAR